MNTKLTITLGILAIIAILGIVAGFTHAPCFTLGVIVGVILTFFGLYLAMLYIESCETGGGEK